MFCKIANLGDMDLKLSGLIFDINIDNAAKFCEASMSRSCISREQAIRAFLDFADPYFIDNMSYIKIFFRFRASLWYLTSGKYLMPIRPAVHEILGGGSPPPDASELSKRADAINC